MQKEKKGKNEMGERENARLPCPHCSYEIKKEAKICPKCGKNLIIVDSCPRCGTRVEKGWRHCSNCGKDLATEEPTTPTTTVVEPTSKSTLKRPEGITIICFLWFIGGALNSYIGLSNLAIDLEAIITVSTGGYWLNAWFSWAVPVEAIIMFSATVLAILQFVTIFGFLKGKSWSWKSGIVVPILATITSWSHMILLITAPSGLVSTTSMTFGIPLVNLFFTTIYIAYLREPHVKKWLRAIDENQII